MLLQVLDLQVILLHLEHFFQLLQVLREVEAVVVTEVLEEADQVEMLIFLAVQEEEAETMELVVMGGLLY